MEKGMKKHCWISSNRPAAQVAEQHLPIHFIEDMRSFLHN